MPPYVAVPSAAWERRHELTTGAWKLYQQYLSHRNKETGRCDPALKTLAEALQTNPRRSNYTHVSDMKRELILKGWIRRTGRNAVELLVGPFPPLKIRPITEARSSENSEDEVRKIPKIETRSSENSEDEVRKIPNLGPGSPFISEQVVVEQVAASSAAPAAHDSQAWKKEPCDEAWVAQVKREGVYPPELVDWVWRKLQALCRRERVVPNKGRLDFWLSTEKGTPPVQPLLGGLGAPVVEANFHAQPISAPRLQDPAPNCQLCGGDGEVDGQTCPCRQCQYCFGTGMEVIAGKGAQRCRCRLPTVEAPPVSAEELQELEEEYNRAQEEMRRAREG